MVPRGTRTGHEETDIALTVAVVGGGIGGLCLAQGLRRARLDATVYERDQTLDERGRGYRLHVNPAHPANPVKAIGEYEQRMRDHGYAAVEASRQAEAETGSRRNRALFWLYRRVARG